MTAIRFKIEEDTVERGDLVIVENTKSFTKNLIYEVLEASRSLMILQNKSGSLIQFTIDDSRVYKVQNCF